MNAKRIPKPAILPQDSFDITSYPIEKQDLPGWLRTGIEAVVLSLPGPGRGRRPAIDEGEFLMLLAESLWAHRKVGCVERTARTLALDMTRRLKSNGSSKAVSKQQVRNWLALKPVAKCGERRKAAHRAVRGLMVMYRKQVFWGDRLGPKKMLLHGQGEEAMREFWK